VNVANNITFIGDFLASPLTQPKAIIETRETIKAKTKKNVL
jgi:hypothetical protein